MTKLLTVLEEINRTFEEINDRDIRRVQRGLNKTAPSEKPLGVIHNEALKRLWALADRYRGEIMQAMLDAHRADTDEQAQELRERALRCVGIEEVVRDLFWAQAKDDIGAWSGTGSTGIREDWMLVRMEAKQSPSLAAILGEIHPQPE